VPNAYENNEIHGLSNIGSGNDSVGCDFIFLWGFVSEMESGYFLMFLQI
jgi:hypothetical protein